MIQIKIDNKDYTVPQNYTIIQACQLIDIELPRFCYHERLSIAGNCRICLVEVNERKSVVAACVQPVRPGLEIITNSSLVKKAREGVLEFLLANHPLDCPICDQGGECDLQDQTILYGSDRGRFFGIKNAVEDKECGPLVKTVISRCINCTRCVRFATEIGGVPDLGIIGRGQSIEVGTYVEQLIGSELSGNVIDLCPVGALTNKPYAFKARPWELSRRDSIDIFDGVGSNISINARGSELIRIIPQLNEAINDEWISDKTRFAFDGLIYQRLNQPLIKDKNSNWQIISWDEAFQVVSDKFKKTNPNEIQGYIGKLNNAESILAFSQFIKTFGVENTQSNPYSLNLKTNDFSSDFRFNTKFENINKSDLCLIIGVNPRLEGSILNVKLNNAVKHHNIKIYTLNVTADLSYPSITLSNNINTLLILSEGRHPLCQKLRQAKNPIIIIGYSMFKRDDSEIVWSLVQNLKNHIPNLITNNWNGWNFLHPTANGIFGLELGLITSKPNLNSKLIYSLGADENIINITSSLKENNPFVIYQGHHGGIAANYADLILPTTTFTEAKGHYINTEGRWQSTQKIISGPKQAYDDWKIICGLSEFIGKPLPYKNKTDIFNHLQAISPTLSYDINSNTNINNINNTLKLYKNNLNGTINRFYCSNELIDNFYITDIISKNSPTIARCTSEFLTKKKDSLINFPSFKSTT